MVVVVVELSALTPLVRLAHKSLPNSSSHNRSNPLRLAVRPTIQTRSKHTHTHTHASRERERERRGGKKKGQLDDGRTDPIVQLDVPALFVILTHSHS